MIGADIATGHEQWVFSGVVVSTLGVVTVAWLQTRKIRRENTDQHSLGQQNAERRHKEMLAALQRQDETRGHQVDGLHTAIGRVDGKLEAHMHDAVAHGKKEP